MDEGLLSTITRVRRGTRSPDVLELCDALERLLLVRAPAVVPVDPVVRKPSAPGSFDRKTFMREYMKRRRAKERSS